MLASINKSDNSDISISYLSVELSSVKSSYISYLVFSNCYLTYYSVASELNSGVSSTTGDITNSPPSSLTSGSSFALGTSSEAVYDKSSLSRALA
uniref:Uncharacterized protein n=1 Tax=Podoviridae sp. ct8Lf7 TaxID=2827723 RepID=A0A8S5S1Q8_9CAUD|nr:MAG TPA: hypothetical protein [Podoviridae sp. ct8Lf7]